MRLFFIALFLLISLPAFAAEQDVAACDPVAEIYGQQICALDIAITEKAHKNIAQYATKNGKNPQETEMNILKTNLFSLLWEKALIQKFGKDAIEPTSAEKNTYLKIYQNSMKEQYGFDKDLTATIKDLLEKNKYAPEIYQKLNRLGAQKQKAVLLYEKRDTMPAEMKMRIDKGEEKVAEAMVKSWKVKKLLYETYGGRIAFRETELEPVDAYQKFLDEIKVNGNTKILNDAFKDVFSTMEDYLKAENVVIPANAPEIKDYFAAPGWLYSSDVGRQVFTQAKAQIKAMPTLGTTDKKEAP